MKPGDGPTRIVSGGLAYTVDADVEPRRRKSGDRVFAVTQEGLDREQALVVWRMWRSSPELLAHTVRVAERVTDAVETTIDVAVRDDHERFASPKEFVEDVTIDALRNFNSIAIRVRGPKMTAAIGLDWLEGDNKAQVVATAAGGEAFAEQVGAALTAICRAIERGGTHRKWTQRFFQVGVQALFFVAFMVIGLAAFILLAYTPIPGWLASTPFAPLGTDDGLSVIVGGAAGVLAVAGGGVAAVWFGRRAYPSLEVAEGGQTRLQRASRRLGAFFVASAITIALKLFNPA